MIIKQTLTLVAIDDEGHEVHRVVAKQQHTARQLKHVGSTAPFLKRAWDSLREGVKEFFEAE